MTSEATVFVPKLWSCEQQTKHKTRNKKTETIPVDQEGPSLLSLLFLLAFPEYPKAHGVKFT